MTELSDIIEKLKKSKKIAIFCHVRPDGDALGSGLALCKALTNAGKMAYLCCDDPAPEKFAFLPAMAEVKQTLPAENYDAFVSVDCADITRLGEFSKAYIKFRGPKINIDHHVSNGRYGDLNYVRVCTASCEIMCDLLREAGYEITEEVANLLMTGLVSDSGVFTHQDVTKKTLETAAYLREKGADINAINYNLYSRQTKARALLYGKVMSKMRFALEDKFAFIIISAADMAEFGTDKSVTEGFVDFPLTVDGVEVAASILEFKSGQYKVSLRSKGKVNVNSVASSFGGGGHVLASGCMIFGLLEEVVERLSYAVYQNL